MKRITYVGVLIIVGALVGGIFGGHGLYADEKEYKSTAKMTKLIENEPLSGLEGQVANVFVAEMPEGWVGGKHYHPGHVFVYVLEGAMTLNLDGKDPVTIEAGEVYHETPGQKMLAKNTSASEDLKIVVFQVGTQGKPVMIKAE